MTITSLEDHNPHFSPDLRCRIAEMVNETSAKTETEESVSVLDIFLPKIHFVDEGLALFFSAKKEIQRLSETNSLINDCLIYMRTIRQHTDANTDPALKVAIQALNAKRTGFTDQFYRKGILVEEYFSAIKTIYMDLPELIQNTRYFAAGVIHPLLDKDPELLAETFYNLEKVRDQNYHKHFDLHCHQLRGRDGASSLLPPNDETYIPTSGNDICWPNSYLISDPIQTLYEFIPEIIAEGVEQVKDQFLSLRYNIVTDNFIKALLNSAQAPLLNAWSRVVEQIRLLMFLLDTHLSIQESALSVQRKYLKVQLDHETDAALKTIILTKLKPILNETNEDGNGEEHKDC